MFTKINSARFVLCTVVLMIFTYVFDMVVHGNLLMPYYNQSAGLWRPMADMQAMFGICLLYHFALAAVFTYVFTRHFENRGVDEGVRYGLYMGLFAAVLHGSSYIWMPISGALAVGWMVAILVWSILSGLILALLYKN